MDRLKQVAGDGRRFTLDRFVEEDGNVAVALLVTDPRWEGPVDVAKVFRFRTVDDKVVFMEDCLDWDDALTRLRN